MSYSFHLIKGKPARRNQIQNSSKMMLSGSVPTLNLFMRKIWPKDNPWPFVKNKLEFVLVIKTKEEEIQRVGNNIKSGLKATMKS